MSIESLCSPFRSYFCFILAAHIPSPDAMPWRLGAATGSVKASIHIINTIRNLSLAII